MAHRRKIALTVIAVVLTISACWHTFESVSALIRNGLFAPNLGPAAMSNNAQNLISVLFYIAGFWAMAALAWLVREKTFKRPSEQTAFQQSASQSPDIWPPAPTGETPSV